MNTIVWYFEHTLALPFFGIWMKIDLFKSCGHCWDFQICWHIEYSTLTASSFRVLNNSAEIPSPSLALLVVMLPRADLTLHSSMHSRWVITPLWLSGSLIPVIYSFSMYSCHLSIFPSSVRFLQSLSFFFFFVHFCRKYSLDVSNFLEEISSLSHSIVFLYFFVLLTLEGFLISPCYSLELYIWMDRSFLFSSDFHFSSQLFVKPPQITILPLFFLGMILITASLCILSIVLLTLSQL